MRPVTSWPVGALIAAGRRSAGIKSARAAAKLAGFDEATWRNLESGKRKVSAQVEVDYRPTPETLARACGVAKVDPAKAFALMGWDYDPKRWPTERPPKADPTERLIEALESVAERLESVADRLEGKRP